MDAAAELTLLEAAYTAIVTNGVKSYSVDGRSITYHDLPWLTERMDKLRVAVNRAANGMCSVAQMRRPE